MKGGAFSIPPCDFKNSPSLSSASVPSKPSPPSSIPDEEHLHQHPIKAIVALHQGHLDTLLLEAKPSEGGPNQGLATSTSRDEFASNGTASTITIPGSDIMDPQKVEEESLLSEAARRKSRRLVYLCGFCASLTSILLGYDVGVMSVARKYVDRQLSLTSVQSEIVMGSLNLVAAFGGLIAGKAADKFGRNRAIALACLIFVTGSACMTMAWNFRMLLVGRIVTGLGVGCGFVIAPVYIAEITPPDIRGRMVSLTDVCINIGIVLGSVVGFLCQQTIRSDDAKWRVMLGIGIIPPIVILLFLRVLPESPRWLLLQGRVPEARHVLRKITGLDQEAEREVVAIEEAIQMERDVTTDWSEVLCPRHRAILLPVLMGLGLGFFQQASGSEAAVYYSPKILAEAGVSGTAQQSIGNIAICTFKFVGEIIAMLSMDRVGRKPLFVLSALGSGCFLVVAGACFQFRLPPFLLASSLCLFMGFFSVGMGAITFVVASEIFPLPVRGKAMALAVFINRLLSGVVALTFLSLVDAVTYAKTFYLFAAFSFLSTVFYGCFLPETKGKSLEDISILFEKESAEYEAHAHHQDQQQRRGGLSFLASSSSFSPTAAGTARNGIGSGRGSGPSTAGSSLNSLSDGMPRPLTGGMGRYHTVDEKVRDGSEV
ncbi:hypothetical protein VYU27_001476 [Nannochloropsis oceanica]